MNASALHWDCTDRSRSVNFLENTGGIRTNLYEKPVNLHMYLPPHSAHPPGVLRGLIIHGMVGRICRLCSHPSDPSSRPQTTKSCQSLPALSNPLPILRHRIHNNRSTHDLCFSNSNTPLRTLRDRVFTDVCHTAT
jgi:hypothetical protein